MLGVGETDRKGEKERDRERNREKRGGEINLVEVGAFLIPVLWRQEDSWTFKASQGCTVSLLLKTKQNLESKWLGPHLMYLQQES